MQGVDSGAAAAAGGARRGKGKKHKTHFGEVVTGAKRRGLGAQRLGAARRPELVTPGCPKKAGPRPCSCVISWRGAPTFGAACAAKRRVSLRPDEPAATRLAHAHLPADPWSAPPHCYSPLIEIAEAGTYGGHELAHRHCLVS